MLSSSSIRRSTAFFLCCLSVIAGVAAHSFLWPNRHAGDPFVFYVAFLALCALGLLFLRRRRVFAVGLLTLGLCSLGWWRYAVSIPNIGEGHIAFYNGHEVRLRGVVSEEPDAHDQSTRYRLDDLALVDARAQTSRALDGRLLFTARPLPAYRYGDVFEFTCGLKKPEPFKEFDYAAYLSRENIYALCAFPEQVRLIASGQGNPLKAKLLAGKSLFAASVARILPEPHAAFLGGLLYGARRSIPEDLQEDFRRTGTAHLVALSGYNISVVAGFILAIFIWLSVPRRAAFPLAVVSIGCFIILAGAGASLVRAGIMGGVVLLAKSAGRISRVRNVLALSAAIMLLQNPKILAFDVGFQLSFAATLGLVAFGPYFTGKFSFLTSWLGLREAASATFSAIIATLPLILHQFGTLSLIAPLANILVVPMMPITMMTGFLAGLLGLVSTVLGTIAGYFAWLPLQYEISVIRYLARFPVAERPISSALMTGLYILLSLFWMWILYRGQRNEDQEHIPTL